MPDCELISTCAFFERFSKTHVAVCDGIIAEYCRGTKQGECRRKQHLLKHGAKPPENMLPGGSIVRLDAEIFCQSSDATCKDDA